MSTYIIPPKSEECTWSSGPPPEIGWWPASFTKDPRSLRYWNGQWWSYYVSDACDSKQAERVMSKKANQDGILWCQRWW